MRNIIEEIIKTKNVLFLWLNNKDLYLAKLIVKYPKIKNKIVAVRKGEQYQLLGPNIVIVPQKQLYIIESYDIIQSLIKYAGAVFYTNENNDIIVEIRGTKIIVTTLEEVHILNEIFLEGVYSYNNKKECCVIDVGMNVCFASLYFSTMPNVNKVIGFEPFIKTYEQGLNNLALNPNLKGKIETHDFGLGGSDKYLTLDYRYDVKGSIGVAGIKWYKDIDKTVKEKIRICDVNLIFNGLYEKYNKMDIIMKIDCEGAEYEIIEALSRSNNINKIKALMIEWHQHGPNDILKMLTEAGFTTFNMTTNDGTGMIYASK